MKNAIILGVLGLMAWGGASELQAASYLGPNQEEQVTAVYFRVGPSYRHYRYYNNPGRYYYPGRYYRNYHYDPYYYPRGNGIYFRF